jgi:diketogulonate reductase-like aldo/keto reductase
MPWDIIKLNDGSWQLFHRSPLPTPFAGHEIPSLGFGTWKLGNGESPIHQVDQAISVGFAHVGRFAIHLILSAAHTKRALDTAQAYRNEAEAGIAIRESGLERKDIFITTKYSGVDGLDIKTSINNSLKNVGSREQVAE